MHIETELRIPIDHPAFAGHFPGNPIVPGVVLLDEVVHAAMTAGPSAEKTCRVVSAKFLSPVRPGEIVKVSLEVEPSGNTRFDLAVSDRKVATGTLMLAPKP